MEFNPEKCEVLRISRKKTVIVHDYVLHGTVLKSVKNTKYLGVHLAQDLKWNIHISKIVAKGNQTLGFLKRNLKVKSPTLREKTYKAILRPKIEYCSAIWDPRKGVENNGSHKLEMVQRRAARWVLSRHHPLASVSDMLKELGWTCLENRRRISRLVLFFKIVHGLVAVDKENNLKRPLRKTRHVKEHSFLKPKCSTESHRLSFFPKTINQWNALPECIFQQATNVNKFRSLISQH